MAEITILTKADLTNEELSFFRKFKYSLQGITTNDDTVVTKVKRLVDENFLKYFQMRKVHIFKLTKNGSSFIESEKVFDFEKVDDKL